MKKPIRNAKTRISKKTTANSQRSVPKEVTSDR